MGLTATGYRRLTYDEILAQKISRAKQLFGEDIDTSELTPLGKYLRINAYDQSNAEEEAEGIYYARFPNTANGTSLDRLCVFVGITRNPATYAQYKVTVTGTAGETIPIGFLVGTESGIEYYNTVATEIAVNGTCTIDVECTTAGTNGNVNYNEINKIINPVAYATAVQGTEQVLTATDIESDASLRTRFAEAREGLGSCNENAIRAALLRVPTVTSAGVIVNETDTTDLSGRPPHSFECYVCGGENQHQAIAETIFDKKPLGIKTHGSVTYTITDSGGYTHDINFSHTTNVNVYVKVQINTNNTFVGDNGKEEIKDNIETYINGLGVGKSVYISSLYGQIHAVTGVTNVVSLLLSTNGTTYNTNNITTQVWEVPNCIYVDVEVAE